MTDGRNSGGWGTRRFLVAILGLTAGCALLFLPSARSQERTVVRVGAPNQSQPGLVAFQPATSSPGGCSTTASIVSNFQASGISHGNFIWFDDNLVVQQLQSGVNTIFVRNQTVTFTDLNGLSYNLPVPDAKIVFDPAATSATTTFDTGSNQWTTITNTTGVAGNTFIAGLVYQLPAPDLVGGDNPVTWTGDFTTDSPGVKVQWKWGAAVYTNFTTNYNALGVKPVDDTSFSQYKNSDEAGTPENYKGFLIAGGRGGGGNNFTGGWSGTGSLFPCVAAATPTPTPTPTASPMAGVTPTPTPTATCACAGNSPVSLGRAGGYVALGLNGATWNAIKVTINGDQALGPGNTGSFSQATVNGTLFVDPSADTSGVQSSYVVTGGIVSQDLSGAVADALAASQVAASLTPTLDLGDVRSDTTVTGNGGVNVINMNSVSLTHGTFTINGGPSDIFIFNIQNEFNFNGATLALNGVTACQILWNLPTVFASTPHVVQTAGFMAGTFLAPFRDFSQVQSTIDGAIIGGGMMLLNTNSTLNHVGFCSNLSPTPTPTPTPSSTPTATPTDTPTSIPTPTATPTTVPTNTPTITPTSTPTSNPTSTPTRTPTRTPRPGLTPTIPLLRSGPSQ